MTVLKFPYIEALSSKDRVGSRAKSRIDSRVGMGVVKRIETIVVDSTSGWCMKDGRREAVSQKLLAGLEDGGRW